MKMPKVSCIMPTCYGERYVRTAVQCFLDQDYEGELELVVLDNNTEDHCFSTFAFDEFKYIRTRRKPVGALRNEAIREASGEVICIWDEDDWSAPNRISNQVARLLSTGKQVTGWHNVLYWDEGASGTYKFYFESRIGANHPPYAMGASHCFWKSWWEKHPYIEQGAEDRIFSDEAMHRQQLDSCDAGQLYVARFHGSNIGGLTQNHFGRHKQFPAVERSEFPQEFFVAIGDESNEEQ